MNIDFYLIIGIIILCLILSYIYVKNTKENFQDNNSTADQSMLGMAQQLVGNQNESVINQSCLSEDNINSIVEQASSKYCPVSSDYNPRDFVKKTEIDLVNSCPKQPDLKDYVLKSTIPPIQKCPSCVCPKVKIEAGLTKECPIIKNNCPRPAPCGVQQCRTVIKCEPGHKQVHCPSCPKPKACPQVPEKVCPALSLPKSNFKCPDPKPCSLPSPCKDGEGRCPEQKCPKCEFKGVDTIVKEKSTEDMVNELLNNQDPKLNELLDALKNKLNIKDNEINETNENNEINEINENNENNENNETNENNTNLYKKLKGALNNTLSDYTISKRTNDVIFKDYIEPFVNYNSISRNNSSNKMDPEPFANYMTFL